jgi:surface antigen
MNAKLISILTIACFIFISACKKEDIFLGTMAVTLIGTTIYHHLSMNKADQKQEQYVFENYSDGQSTNWTNSEGNSYTMTVNNTSSNGVCRQYQTVGIIDGNRETLTGTACRQANGYWKIQ